jgi:hypothetical protein
VTRIFLIVLLASFAAATIDARRPAPACQSSAVHMFENVADDNVAACLEEVVDACMPHASARERAQRACGGRGTETVHYDAGGLADIRFVIQRK